MEQIIEQIKQKTVEKNDYWDFKDNTNNFSLTGIMKYPAMMVSEMQKELISIIASSTNVKKMLDPFCGSGITLMESLKCNIEPYGIDINPLAILLVKVKSSNYKLDYLSKVIDKIEKELIKNSNFVIHNFDGIDKWFRDDIKIELSRIRSIIIQIKSLKIRQFLWVVFADLVRDSCNSRTSTYKLYIREDRQIENLPNNIGKIFINKARNALKEFEKFYSLKGKDLNVKLYYGDVLKVLKDRRKFKDNSFDLVCTSPPYGDNMTTITYGQFSVLQLRWIDINDILPNIPENTISSLSAIDKMSLGGKIYTIDEIKQSKIIEKSNSFKSIYEHLVDSGRLDKANKVSSFIMDYDNYFRESIRILRPGGYQVITLGNRTVHDKTVPLDEITIQLSELYGMKYIWSFQRNIRNKRRPRTVNNRNTQTINKETIIILQKKE
jgi:site-specific DNA-methyltransferase (cytosine-N4-specific)